MPHDIRIENRDDLENWLNSLPENIRRQAATAIASRAALRVLPLLEEWLARDEDEAISIVLLVFRAAATSWVAALAAFPKEQLKRTAFRSASAAHNAFKIAALAKDASEIAAASRAAAATVVDSKYSITSAALDAIRAIDAAADAVYKVAPDSRMAAEGYVALQHAAHNDALFIAAHTHDISVPLTEHPLWPESTPNWIAEDWQSMEHRLLAREGEHWEVWTKWYDARLDPARRIPCYSPPNLELEKARILLPEDLWKQGPVAVNARIKELIEQHDCSAPSSPPDRQGDADIPPLEELEPQNDVALVFTMEGEGPIDVDERYGANRLRQDDEAKELHAETAYRARRILEQAAGSMGGNAVVELVNEVRRYADALGSAPAEVKPALLVVRGDVLRNQLAAQENRDDDFSDLPPLPDSYLTELRNLVSAHNTYVALDPELSRRDEARLGPDVRENLVSPAHGMEIVNDAVQEGIATDRVAEVMGEEASVAPDKPDPDNRKSRRYSEGIRNFSRAALARGWKAAKWGGATTGMSYAIAKWIVANQAWFYQAFAHNPQMLQWIEKLMEALKHLPLN